jgi:hypothetical protein
MYWDQRQLVGEATVRQHDATVALDQRRQGVADKPERETRRSRAREKTLFQDERQGSGLFRQGPGRAKQAPLPTTSRVVHRGIATGSSSLVTRPSDGAAYQHGGKARGPSRVKGSGGSNMGGR